MRECGRTDEMMQRWGKRTSNSDRRQISMKGKLSHKVEYNLWAYFFLFAPVSSIFSCKLSGTEGLNELRVEVKHIRRGRFIHSPPLQGRLPCRRQISTKESEKQTRCSPSVTLHCLGTDENDGCVDGRLFVFNCQAKGIKWKTSVRSRWICLTWASGTVPTQRHREGARYESVSLYEQDVKMYQV